MTTITEDQLDTVIHSVSDQLKKLNINLDAEHLFDLNDAIAQSLKEQCCIEITGTENTQQAHQQLKHRQEIIDVLMEDIVGNYDTPDNIPEWNWIERNASYSCVQNGKSGVWDFIINLSIESTDTPAKLRPVIEEAKKQGAAYLLFHQGC